MKSRHPIIIVATAVAAVALLLALHHHRTVDTRADSTSLELRTNNSPTATSVSSTTPLAIASSKARASDGPASFGPVISASNHSDASSDIYPISATPPNSLVVEANAAAAPEPLPKSKPQVPKYWRLTGTNFTLTTDHEFVNTGSSSALLDSLPGRTSPDTTMAVFQACSAADFRGKRAQFTIYLLAAEGFGTADAWLRVDDPTNTKLPVDVLHVAANPPASASDWIAVSVTINVSSTATFLTYGVLLHGLGPLRMDTAKLSVIEATGAVRPEVERDPTPEDLWGASGQVPRYPRNMDFEEIMPEP